MFELENEECLSIWVWFEGLNLTMHTAFQGLTSLVLPLHNMVGAATSAVSQLSFFFCSCFVVFVWVILAMCAPSLAIYCSVHWVHSSLIHPSLHPCCEYDPPMSRHQVRWDMAFWVLFYKWLLASWHRHNVDGNSILPIIFLFPPCLTPYGDKSVEFQPLLSVE